MTQPTLVVWVLYDTTTDVKYIKMNPLDGSLAIFDTEEAAMTAKSLHSGTEYKRCEYYSTPLPTPEVSHIVKLLNRARSSVDYQMSAQNQNHEAGRKHYAHFQSLLGEIDAAIAAYHQQGGGL